jgi:hypothetical protein
MRDGGSPSGDGEDGRRACNGGFGGSEAVIAGGCNRILEIPFLFCDGSLSITAKG